MTKPDVAAEAKNLLQDLIEVLQDGHKGMLGLGQHASEDPVRQFLLRQSQLRAEFAAELENELHRMGERDVEQRGTVGGALHRAWSGLKLHLGAGDGSLLASVELGEEGTKKIYERALAGQLPGDVRDLVATQQSHILAAFDQLRTLRASRAA